jgi:hypothetical protein
MNATKRQPVIVCGRDATLRFNDIPHNVSTFEIIPAAHNQKGDLPQAGRRANRTTWWIG